MNPGPLAVEQQPAQRVQGGRVLWTLGQRLPVFLFGFL